MPDFVPGSQVLIVDDDETFAHVLARALGKRGYPASVAHDCVSAERIMATERQDFAVIDLKIGEESGLSLLPTFKALNPGITMLMLTGYSSIATAVAAIKEGAADYACKPVDADEVVDLLAGRKSSRELAEETEPAPPSIKRLQWEHIQRVLEDNGGNVSATARALGMHRRTLQRILQKRPVSR